MAAPRPHVLVLSARGRGRRHPRLRPRRRRLHDQAVQSAGADRARWGGCCGDPRRGVRGAARDERRAGVPGGRWTCWRRRGAGAAWPDPGADGVSYADAERLARSGQHTAALEAFQALGGRERRTISRAGSGWAACSRGWGGGARPAEVFARRRRPRARPHRCARRAGRRPRQSGPARRGAGRHRGCRGAGAAEQPTCWAGLKGRALRILGRPSEALHAYDAAFAASPTDGDVRIAGRDQTRRQVAHRGHVSVAGESSPDGRAVGAHRRRRRRPAPRRRPAGVRADPVAGSGWTARRARRRRAEWRVSRALLTRATLMVSPASQVVARADWRRGGSSCARAAAGPGRPLPRLRGRARLDRRAVGDRGPVGHDGHRRPVLSQPVALSGLRASRGRQRFRRPPCSGGGRSRGCRLRRPTRAAMRASTSSPSIASAGSAPTRPPAACAWTSRRSPPSPSVSSTSGGPSGDRRLTRLTFDVVHHLDRARPDRAARPASRRPPATTGHRPALAVFASRTPSGRT